MKPLKVGNQVTLFRLMAPHGVHVVAKAFKHFVELDDGTRWRQEDGGPHKGNDALDFHVDRWQPAHQEWLNSRITLYNDGVRISRQVRVKRIHKESVVVDYGEGSNFEMKISYKTRAAIDAVASWQGFLISELDVEILRERWRDSEE